MPKITNERYVTFLKGELMETIPREKFEAMLKEIKDKMAQESRPPDYLEFRTFFILLWITGARPHEILNLKAGDIVNLKDENIRVKLTTGKFGVPRTLLLPLNDALVKEVWDYAKAKFPEMKLFWKLRSKAKRTRIVRVRRVKHKDGRVTKEKKVYEGEYFMPCGKVYHYIKKWFGITPYYFRHNRFSLAAEDLSIRQLMRLKGAKTEKSVYCYLHQTEKEAKEISKSLLT